MSWGLGARGLTFGLVENQERQREDVKERERNNDDDEGVDEERKMFERVGFAV